MNDSYATVNVPQVMKEYSPVQISVAGATDERMYTEFDVAVTTTFVLSAQTSYPIRDTAIVFRGV